MIDKTILDKICPVPDEDEEMENIRQELEDEGFKINSFKKGGIFYIIIRIFVTIYIELKNLSRTIINNLFVAHAEEEWLEIKGADFGKTRNEAVKARGYITIYRSDYSNALQVMKGHMFKTKPDVNGNELKYYAVETTVINAGEETGKILVEAENSGTGYNVSAGMINISMIHLDGVDSVSNEKGWLQKEGADIEDIERFRQRVEESWSEVAELTTEDKLMNVARGVSGVLDVKIDAQHPRGQGTTDIIITGTGGEATEELLKAVEEETRYLKGNYDDFLYKSSEVVIQDISLTLYIAKGEAKDGIKEQAESVISNMMQLSNRTELNCLYMDDIRYMLKKEIESYKRVMFNSPEEDIELENHKVVMLGTLSVDVVNVGGEQ